MYCINKVRHLHLTSNLTLLNDSVFQILWMGFEL